MGRVRAFVFVDLKSASGHFRTARGPECIPPHGTHRRLLTARATLSGSAPACDRCLRAPGWDGPKAAGLRGVFLQKHFCVSGTRGGGSCSQP